MAMLDMQDRPATALDEERLMDYPDSTEEIPTLDLAAYLANEPGAREETARRLGEITETVGFFYLKGHGITQDLVDRVFAQSRRFHGLAEAEKRKVPYVVNGSFRSGYQPIATPRNKDNVDIIQGAKPNLLSKFSMNREVPLPEGHKGDGDFRDKNVWPENLPGFRETLVEYQAAIEKLAKSFLPLWATSLDMPPGYFDKLFEVPHLTLTLVHYIPQKTIGGRQYGIAPHADNAFMTFLAQSNVGGLAVRMPSGHWRAVDVIPGTFLVNTGNTMVRWTNDRYLSTKHRVINTAEVDRYSIPVFFGPSGDAMIECIPTCKGPDNSAKYPPMTYRDLRKWYYGYAD